MKITNIEESFLYVVQLLISEAESSRLLEEKLVEAQKRIELLEQTNIILD